VSGSLDSYLVLSGLLFAIGLAIRIGG